MKKAATALQVLIRKDLTRYKSRNKLLHEVLQGGTTDYFTGSTHQEILANYPGLVEEDILACIAYGSEMARERYMAVPLEPVGK